MIRRVIDALAVRWLKKQGYSAYMAPLAWSKFSDDLFRNRHYTLRQKLWAYRRGFLSERIGRYRLSEANHASHLPDVPYLRMHPINGSYSKWIDDKLTMRYVFNNHARYLPEYYFEVHNGRVVPLIDCPLPERSGRSPGSLVSLLRRHTRLALKPWAGSGGEGFCKLAACGDQLYLNDQEVSERGLTEFLGSLRNHIVTEYLTSHPAIQRIYDATPNTLRLMVIHDECEGPQIIGAIMRFGVRESGQVDNVGAGAIYCGVDVRDGRMFRPRRYTDGSAIDADSCHPDTGVEIAGHLPNWTIITSGIGEIARDFPQLRYIGYDVIITESGFKIIEMNSHQALGGVQDYYPLMENEYCRRLFAPLLLRARQPG